MIDVAYDSAFVPPAAVLVTGISCPGSDRIVSVPMIVDSGADCTIVPSSVARALGLPTVDRIEIVGIGGHVHQAAVHAAIVRIDGRSALARVVSLGSEAIAGRDLLARLVVTLDGPRQRLRVARPRRRR